MAVIEIAPRSGTAFTLRAGQVLRVIDPCGMQVSDLLAYAMADIREVISAGRTFDYEETIRLSTGNQLWSNRSNPMLSIIDDATGLHDFLLTPVQRSNVPSFLP